MFDNSECEGSSTDGCLHAPRFLRRHYLRQTLKYAYNMHMDIEWDPDKATSNLTKHGVSFDEAATALLDPSALAQEDPAAESESRWVLIGMTAKARLLTVVYTLRPDDRLRLISARKATRKEASCYA